ncbi:MAG: toxic anion resistance protein [Clostridium sp.]
MIKFEKEDLINSIKNKENFEDEENNNGESLTEEEKNKISEIMNKIISGNVIQYGVGIQTKIANFSDKILEDVRVNDTTNVVDILSELMDIIEYLDVNGFIEDTEVKSIPILGMFFDKTKKFTMKYKKIENKISDISNKLDEEKMNLLKSVVMFDKLFEKNIECIDNLDLFIIAGNKKMKELNEKEIPKLQSKAEKNKDLLAIQRVSDMNEYIEILKKRIYELNLTRVIAVETASQIRLLQEGDKALIEKIQSYVLNTIPLWKNQIALALGLAKQKDTLDLQKEVSDTTGKLLKQNSKILQNNTVKMYKKSENKTVEMETLQKINNDLVFMINETIKISKESRTKYQEAELELMKMEKDLKNKIN